MIIAAQTFVQVVVVGIVCLSFCNEKYVDLIKWVVYLQAFEMVLSNFNHYEEYDHHNFQGLNLLHTVFDVMFSTYNTFLGNLLLDNKFIMYALTAAVHTLNWSIIIYTSFLFDDMSF